MDVCCAYFVPGDDTFTGHDTSIGQDLNWGMVTLDQRTQHTTTRNWRKPSSRIRLAGRVTYLVPYTMQVKMDNVLPNAHYGGFTYHLSGVCAYDNHLQERTPRWVYPIRTSSYPTKSRHGRHRTVNMVDQV